MRCQACGQENPDGFRFCGACGAALETVTAAVREERKVVTVLFADLVGFTSRAEQMDPEDVRALLAPYHARLRQELERFGGTVEKFIGDAVMALFGAPVAHEDDPERATRAALAIRDWVVEEDELQLRIAVNTGEALVALGARPEVGEGMASGDVVNTAARLQAAAPVNGILVGETTWRATRHVIDYAERESVTAKGKAAPVAAWLALQPRARATVEREATAPLVGRERELRVLVDALERVRAEQSVQLVTLVGAPGIGKSRLVYELFRRLEQMPEPVYWRRGRSLPYGEGVAFWALAEIVKAQAGILETDGLEQADEKLRAAVEAAVGEEDSSRLRRQLAPLVGVERSPETDDHRIEAFAAWRRYLEALAEQRPLVLVFEDLHWADEAMLDFVDHLVDWASGVPLLVIATARPELLDRRAAWGGGKPNAATLSLPPLSDEETARLVHSLLERPVLAAETQAELLARAGGNPLYAEEFVRLVAEGRTPEELPETVQGLIAARLDALADEEKTLLQAAAVVGRVFWLGAVGAIAETARWTAEEHLHTLERREFLRRERRSTVAGETEYAFRHLLVRDVAYRQLPRGERAERHRRAADWVESLGRPADHAELLAHHYLSALELDRAAGREDAAFVARARTAARDAGDRALSLNAFPAAARFYEKTLSLTEPADDDRPELLLRLGSALHRIADERAEQTLEQAAQELRAAGRGEAAAEAHALLSELWWDRGKRESSARALEEAHALLGTQEVAARARVLARLARTQALAGRHQEALASAREALPIAERFGLAETRAHLLSTLGTARFAAGDPAGLADLEQSVEIALAAGSHLVANAYNNLAAAYLQAGDVPRDRELRSQAVRLAERFGDRRQLRFARLCIQMLDFYDGHWDRALADADAFVAEFEAGAPHYLESNVRWTRALIRLARADREGAATDARRALELARDEKDPQVLLPALAVNLRLELELSRVDRALELARELLAQPAAHFNRSPAIELAWAATSLGNTDDVRTWVRRIAYASRWTEAAVAILDGDLVRAADVFARVGSLPDEAYARLRTQNPEQVHQAVAFYRSVGATGYLGEAEALLAATG
jgi:predicted ATPase/class 3 adenylate cyclase